MLPVEGMTSETVWTSFEWPELVVNDQITKIIWVNPDDISKLRTLWLPSDGAILFPLGTPIPQIGH